MKNPFRKTVITVRQISEAIKLLRSPNYRFLRFSPPGHFYSSIPDYDELRNRGSHFNQNVKELPGIELREKQQLELIEKSAKFYRELPWQDNAKNSPLRYNFDNIYFSYGDVVTLYCMLRNFRPGRIIEIGSGYSSAAMLDVNELFFNDEIQFTFIEPCPDRLRSLVRDVDLNRNDLLEMPVQDTAISNFSKLEEGDFLFVDSSHVTKTGSDINHLIHHILPHLKSGVIIHFHDILWPFEYPKKWFKAGRAWNEVYLLRAFLQFNPTFEILFFNSFLEHHHRKRLREKLPLMLRQPLAKMTFGNSSLWLRKK
ncbi:class I SAM-dependent methyltransferase [soil metagenome]